MVKENKRTLASSCLLLSFSLREVEVMKLGQILIKKQWVSPSELSQALTKQRLTNQRLGEVLVEESVISAKQLTIALKEQYWRKNGFWVISDGNLPNQNFCMVTFEDYCGV